MKQATYYHYRYIHIKKIIMKKTEFSWWKWNHPPRRGTLWSQGQPLVGGGGGGGGGGCEMASEEVVVVVERWIGKTGRNRRGRVANPATETERDPSLRGREEPSNTLQSLSSSFYLVIRRLLFLSFILGKLHYLFLYRVLLHAISFDFLCLYIRSTYTNTDTWHDTDTDMETY